MPVTVYPVSNPALAEDPHDFESVTEYRDLPRKYECLDDEGNAIYGTNPTYWCQDGCGEEPFQYIVEPGDIIALQFRAVDTLNADPAVPVYGWRESDPTFFIELEAVSLGGAVLWSGNIADVASDWYVAHDGSGSIQGAQIDVDRLLALIDTDCWYFRARVVLGVGDYNSANSDHAPGSPVDYGYRYIDLIGGRVMEWNGAAFTQIGPTDVDEVWYSADNAVWYTWTGSGWSSLATPPAASGGGNTDEYVTMTYRVRRCDEPIVHFASEEGGVDCLGFTHELPSATYVMDPIEGLRFIDRFSPLPSVHPDNLALPEGTTLIVQGEINPMRRTSFMPGSGGGPWEFILPTSVIGDLWLLMNTSGGYAAGIVFERVAPVPNYWQVAGLFSTLYPGVAFSNDTLQPAAFQHDFKISGSCQLDDIPVARELSKNARLIRRTIGRQYRVRTIGVPEVVAQRIGAVIAAKKFMINGVRFDDSDSLKRNNDEGEHWLLDFNVRIEDCSTDASCD